MINRRSFFHDSMTGLIRPISAFLTGRDRVRPSHQTLFLLQYREKEKAYPMSSTEGFISFMSARFSVTPLLG